MPNSHDSFIPGPTADPIAAGLSLRIGAGAKGHSRLIRCPLVFERKMTDETLLIHSSTGNYYALNTTGAALWHYCAEGRTREEILNFISCEFETEKSLLGKDVDPYLEQLLEEGILEIVRSSPPQTGCL